MNDLFIVKGPLLAELNYGRKKAPYLKRNDYDGNCLLFAIICFNLPL